MVLTNTCVLCGLTVKEPLTKRSCQCFTVQAKSGEVERLRAEIKKLKRNKR